MKGKVENMYNRYDELKWYYENVIRDTDLEKNAIIVEAEIAKRSFDTNGVLQLGLFVLGFAGAGLAGIGSEGASFIEFGIFDTNYKVYIKCFAYIVLLVVFAICNITCRKNSKIIEELTIKRGVIENRINELKQKDG